MKPRIQNAPKELEKDLEQETLTDRGEVSKEAKVEETQEGYVNTPTIDDVKEIAKEAIETQGGGEFPENVALTDAQNTFTENQTIEGNLTLTGDLLDGDGNEKIGKRNEFFVYSENLVVNLNNEQFDPSHASWSEETSYGDYTYRALLKDGIITNDEGYVKSYMEKMAVGSNALPTYDKPTFIYALRSNVCWKLQYGTIGGVTGLFAFKVSNFPFARHVVFEYDESANAIKLNGATQTYEQIKAICQDTQRTHAVLWYADMYFEPRADDGGGMCEFTSVWDYMDEIHVGRIAINSDNEVKYTDTQVAHLEDGKVPSSMIPVTANPTEEATETLSKLKVGEVVYGIEGGEKKTLTINCVTDELVDPTTLTGISIEVFDSTGEKIAEDVFNGTPVSFELPLSQAFEVKYGTFSEVGEKLFLAKIPLPVIKGTLTSDKSYEIVYSAQASFTTLAEVKDFLALDFPIEAKRKVLVASETNSLSFDIDLYANGTNNPKTETATLKVWEVDTYKQLVDGEVKEFVGATIGFSHVLANARAFDEREQLQCDASETFSNELSYFSATTSGLGDKIFTYLRPGTDFNYGDSIGTYQTDHSVFVFKHGLRNNSNKLNDNSLILQRGSNVYHYSNIHKWLNGEGLDWFTSSYVGDIKSSSYNNVLGFKSWFKREDLDCIRENVEFGVYERSGFELPNNKMYAMFALPSGRNFAGQVNDDEGTPFDYWLYLNDGATSNATKSTRVMKNRGGSNQNIWFRSPSRGSAYLAWYLYAGYCNDGGNGYVALAVSPLFVI